MSTYYDKKTKTWFCQFRYTDYTGKVKQKRKRGFKLQREAKEWERSFLEQTSRTLNMKFEQFIELYNQDLSHRLKPKTLYTKKYIIQKHIIPYFKDKNMNEISAMDIRTWQNYLIANYNYSESYLKKINGIFNAIFNYASKYYDLKDNPCLIAGSIGKNTNKKKIIYTQEQVDHLLSNVFDYTDYTIFSILYYTGMRKGELFALTKKDIDLNNGTININKSCQRIEKKYVITSPKTQNSVRKVDIPQFLVKIIKKYYSSIYNPKDEDYIFIEYLVKSRGRLKMAQKKSQSR